MKADLVLSDRTTKSLHDLGKRLKQARIARGDTQEIFAERLCVSIPTLRSMEAGDANTRIGYWIEALSLMRRLDDVDGLFATQPSLFDEKPPTRPRQRVRK